MEPNTIGILNKFSMDIKILSIREYTVKGELDLLRKLNLPVPHECPKCRENKRFERIFYRCI